MKINANQNTINNKIINPSNFYSNKHLLRGLKFASKNGALFSATTALALSVIARPIVIMATPKTDKENKKHACAKSLASSIVGYGIMLLASTPIAKAVEKIDENPNKYLKADTIKTLQNGAKTLNKSKSYMLATQIFKLGIGLIIALPKSALTCYLITPILKIFPKKETKQKERIYKQNSKIISFKGIKHHITENIAKGIGAIIDNKQLQKFVQKYKDTNFAQHIMNTTDVVLTASFIKQVTKDKNIEKKRKKPLIHNSVIATTLSITGGYVLNKLLKKPTDKFIENFKIANKNLPELERYIEGIKIAKPTIILGTIYYIFIPLISTFLADRTEKIK